MLDKLEFSTLKFVYKLDNNPLYSYFKHYIVRNIHKNNCYI